MMAAAALTAAAIAVLFAGNCNRGRLKSQALVKHWTRFRIVRLSSSGFQKGNALAELPCKTFVAPPSLAAGHLLACLAIGRPTGTAAALQAVHPGPFKSSPGSEGWRLKAAPSGLRATKSAYAD